MKPASSISMKGFSFSRFWKLQNVLITLFLVGFLASGDEEAFSDSLVPKDLTLEPMGPDARDPDSVSLELVKREKPPGSAFPVPRPMPDAGHVPLRTSFFIVFRVPEDEQMLYNSLSIRLKPDSGAPFYLLKKGRAFAEGYSGRFLAPGRLSPSRYSDRAVGVYVDTAVPLQPATTYELKIAGASRQGSTFPASDQSWSFTTAADPGTRPVTYDLDAQAAPDVTWKGMFFNGLAKVSFSSTPGRIAHYELIEEMQARFPNAWDLQRNAWLTGFAHQPNALKKTPNIVRELETRRIVSMTRQESGVLLNVEDFYGHEQYGIPSHRPVSADYHAGDEILIADGVNSARAQVIAADDEARTVLVTPFDDPPDGWKIEYSGPLPQTENPAAPGLFPPGGTYLRKFDPVGTPRYYWGRLDHEYDIVVQEYGRRIVPRFADAPGDLSIDGGTGTTAKDLVQLRQVVYDITSHLIERYGDVTLTWPWTIFNEPDLASIFWRIDDWDELQRFYDYTVDGILKAFEDHGYDSDQVIVGGLELGAISGTDLKLEEFLYHTSPNASGAGAVEKNAACADTRLDGKRSRRVETLCRANEGEGAPLDFVSIHSYTDSEMMGDKLILGKEIALEIDPQSYADLWVNSYEAVPAWRSIVDPGAAHMYLGNGYFPTWTVDVASRLLHKAAVDPRYAYGESLVTVWQEPQTNFEAQNGLARAIRLTGRTEIVPRPITHAINFLSTMGPEFWVFPEQQIGGHTVSGFASPGNDPGNDELRVLLYSHHGRDVQSRSEQTFDVSLNLQGIEWERVSTEAYQIDRENNSAYTLAKAFRQHGNSSSQVSTDQVFTEEEFGNIEEALSLDVTQTSTHSVGADRSVRLTAEVAGNGINFLVIKRANNE